MRFDGVNRRAEPIHMSHPRPQDKLRCGHCGDVIGAYEPMVAMIDGVAQKTSKASAMAGGPALGDCYHAHCFEQLSEAAG